MAKKPNQTYHAAVAVGADWGFASTGTAMVVVKFKLIEGKWAGNIYTWRGFLTDSTAERTIESLRYCGWTGDTIGDVSGIGDVKVMLVLAPEEYKGKTYLKVQWVNRYGGGDVNLGDQAMGEEDKRRFTTMFDAYLKQHRPITDGVKADAPAPKTPDSGPLYNDQGDSKPSHDFAEPPPIGDDDAPYGGIDDDIPF